MTADSANDREQREETQTDTQTSNQTGVEIEEELREQLPPIIDEVENHDVFDHVDTVEDARIFLNHYCFAAWDFQILVEAYRQPEQASNPLDCLPPVPPSPDSGGLADQIAYNPQYGEYIDPTHEIVGKLMDFIDADVGRFHDFTLDLQDREVRLGVALQENDVPPESREHIRTTVSIVHTQNLPRIVGALALGRRDIIPIEFAKQLKHRHIESSPHRIEVKGRYLDIARGIEVDNLLHVDRLLSDPRLPEDDGWREEALQGAAKMLMARRELLNGIKDKVQTDKDGGGHRQ
jgi:hypothetical protein